MYKPFINAKLKQLEQKTRENQQAKKVNFHSNNAVGEVWSLWPDGSSHRDLFREKADEYLRRLFICVLYKCMFRVMMCNIYKFTI